MLTNADRIYFIDPLTDPFAGQPEKILITGALREHSNASLVNTIVPVKNKKAWDMARLWYVTEGGDYVHGVATNRPLRFVTSHTLGILPDGGWITGQSYYDGPEALTIMEAKRSDQQRLDAPDGLDWVAPTIMVKEWVPAAPWAHELMPEPHDSDAVVNAKLAVAKEKHRHRKAWNEILHQAGWRDWTEHLDDVRDNGHSIPTPTFGAHVTAQVFMPTGERVPAEAALNDRTSTLWNRVQELSLGYTSRDESMMISAHTQFPSAVQVHNLSEVIAVDRDIHEAHARNYFSDHGIRLGSHNASLVLRSAS